jgi:hypothetical protein
VAEVSHLVYDGMAQAGAFTIDANGVALTTSGRRLVAELGIDVDTLAGTRRPLCRTCLDWSERRYHLAGSLGSALLERFKQLGWARRVKDSRVIAFSGAGEQALRKWSGGPEMVCLQSA